MPPIHFCLNNTSTDNDGQLISGSQLDRYFRPVWEALDELGADYTIGRQPVFGGVNIYPNHRSAYIKNSRRLDAVSIGVSHGIADKVYLNGYTGFTTVFAPGHAHAQFANRRARNKPRHLRPNIVALGYPKLDPFYNGQVDGTGVWSTDGRIKVLYAPTHGGGSERFQDGNPNRPGAGATSWWARDEVLTLLNPDDFEVVLSCHPRHHPGKQATFTEYKDADVVIADGGSTIYEAWCLDKPVVLTSWLVSDRNIQRGQLHGGTLEQYIYTERIGRHVTDPSRLAETVKRAAKSGITFQEKEMSAFVLPVEWRGTSGMRWAQAIVAASSQAPRMGPRTRMPR